MHWIYVYIYVYPVRVPLNVFQLSCRIFCQYFMKFTPKYFIAFVALVNGNGIIKKMHSEYLFLVYRNLWFFWHVFSIEAIMLLHFVVVTITFSFDSTGFSRYLYYLQLILSSLPFPVSYFLVLGEGVGGHMVDLTAEMQSCSHPEL